MMVLDGPYNPLPPNPPYGLPYGLPHGYEGPGDPGDILMDEDTYHFVKDDYEIEDFGTHELKGFEKKIQVYRLK